MKTDFSKVKDLFVQLVVKTDFQFVRLNKHNLKYLVHIYYIMTEQITDIKAVKNSVFIREDNGDFVCLHYNTEIFRASRDQKGNYEIVSLYVPSVTSSKMAKRCIEKVFGSIPDSKDWKDLKAKHEKIRSLERS